jgi:hypothetical protein
MRVRRRLRRHARETLTSAVWRGAVMRIIPCRNTVQATADRAPSRCPAHRGSRRVRKERPDILIWYVIVAVLIFEEF